MDLGLQGKRALVTGSTKGLGRAIVETLLAEGASVSICARNADEVAAAVKELSSLGKVFGGAVDAADSATLREWVASSADQLGGIDIYVHNTSGKPARKIDGWINNFNIDLMALVHGVDAASAALANGGGSLISIGTTATCRTLCNRVRKLQRAEGRSDQLDTWSGSSARCTRNSLQRRLTRTDLCRRW